MSKGMWAKVAARTAAEVCQFLPPVEGAEELPVDGLTPRQFLEGLVRTGSLPSAVRFLAHALPKREAVWWACQCTRQVLGPNPPAPLDAALQAAEKWAADPSDANRWKAQEASTAAGLGTPAGCAALAAFLSGGSLAPPPAPVVAPGEKLTAQAAAGAVMLAAVLTEPQRATEKYQTFLTLGSDVADGVNQWR